MWSKGSLSYKNISADGREMGGLTAANEEVGLLDVDLAKDGPGGPVCPEPCL